MKTFKIICGAFELELDADEEGGGISVQFIKNDLVERRTMKPDAAAFLNGTLVQGNPILRAGDVLEFLSLRRREVREEMSEDMKNLALNSDDS